jgi:uncharacterized protein
LPDCPECEADLDIDMEEIEEGDVVACSVCGTEYEIVKRAPLELSRVDDDSDDELGENPRYLEQDNILRDTPMEQTLLLYDFFVQKYFGSPFGMATVDDALAKTNEFFCEHVYSEARHLLNDLCRLSLSEVGSNSMQELHYRMEEHLARLDVSFQKNARCSFDDPIVQATCGALYLDGKRIKRNPERAIPWLEKSAKQNNIYSLYTLAKRYLDGDGVSADPKRSVKLLELAASLGDCDSALLLAALFEGGEVPTDYVLAAKWARVAALQGSAEAQGRLGVLYFTGRGVAQNITEAYAWMVLSAEAGNETGSKNLAFLSRQMSSAQQQTAYSRANELKAMIAGTAE